MELKKRNLPVSGSKPQLIERIKLNDNTSAVRSVNGIAVAGRSNASSGNNTPMLSEEYNGGEISIADVMSQFTDSTTTCTLLKDVASPAAPPTPNQTSINTQPMLDFSDESSGNFTLLV